MGPGVNDGIAIEEIDRGHDAIPELLFGRDADTAEHRAGQLGEEPSTRLSQEPYWGVKVNLKRPAGCSANQTFVSLEICAE